MFRESSRGYLLWKLFHATTKLTHSSRQRNKVAFTDMSTKERVTMASSYLSSEYSFEVRVRAIELLSSLAALRNKQSLNAIASLLKDPNAEIRKTAAKELGKIGISDEADILQSHLTLENHPQVVEATEEAIRQIEIRLTTSSSPE